MQRPLRGGPEVAISVSKVETTAEASFCESVEAGHSSHDDSALIAQAVSDLPFFSNLENFPQLKTVFASSSSTSPRSPFGWTPSASTRPLPGEMPRFTFVFPHGLTTGRGSGSVLLSFSSSFSRFHFQRSSLSFQDHASGFLLVLEAGGKVDDVNGAPLNFGLGRSLEQNAGVVATNGLIHSHVLEAVKEILQKKADDAATTEAAASTSATAASAVENGDEHLGHEHHHDAGASAHHHEPPTAVSGTTDQSQ